MFMDNENMKGNYKFCAADGQLLCHIQSKAKPNQAIRTIERAKENNLSSILLAKEGGVAEVTYLHPPIVGQSPAPLYNSPLDIPNKFVKDLYIKYPFLIPKEIPNLEPLGTIQKGYTSQYEDHTTYQDDFCHMDEEEPQLTGARGLALPEGEKPPNRLPGTPYIPGSRNPLSPHYQVDKVFLKKEKAEASKILKKNPPMPKRISEYEDNYNSMVRSWKRHGLYTEPEVYIPRKQTLPP